jgi:hypothetical protein
MNRRQICAIAVYFLALIVFANVANAQSKDRDNPTRLTSNKISSPIYVDSNETVYYSFEAGPGEVTATLSVDPERRGTNQVIIDFLLPETGKSLATMSVYAYIKAEQQVQRFTLSRRQMVNMRISPGANSHEGRYQVLLSGAVKVGQSGIDSLPEPPVPSFNLSSKDKTDSSGCLPKQGTLIIKMKDGSKKIIDLSEAESVTVVP